LQPAPKSGIIACQTDDHPAIQDGGRLMAPELRDRRFQRWTYILAASACLLVFAGGWVVVSDQTNPVQAQMVDAAEDSGSGILDGMTFSGQVTSNGEPLDVIDKWVFAHGTFESTECSNRCNYPPAPYFVRHVDEAVEFVSESRCLDRNAKIVWRGTIDNATVKGTMTWTQSRWYWTIEKEFGFEGTLSEPATAMAGK
jgi:hypothetical protein